MEEILAGDPIGPSPERQRAVREVREEVGSDPAVVIDHVAFREPQLRKEYLVEVGKRHRSRGRPRGTPGSTRPWRWGSRRLGGSSAIAVAPVGPRLELHLGGRNLVPHAQEHGGAQHAVGRELRVLHFHDDLGPDPCRRLQRAGGSGEGAGRGLERFEALEERPEVGVAQAPARLADVHERAVARIILPEHERPEGAFAVPLAAGEAADDGLQRPPHLDLLPVRAPDARPVGACAPLCDDPLQPVLGGGLEQRRAVPLHGVAPQHPGRQCDAFEDLAALRKRERAQVPPVEVQAVEHRIDHRDPLGRLPDVGFPDQVEPVLESREARPPALVGREDLAIEDDVRLQGREGGDHVRKLGVQPV